MIEKYFEVICEACDTVFVVPKELHDAATKSSEVPFFCPYGHELVFDPEDKLHENPVLIENKTKPKLKLVVNNDVE